MARVMAALEVLAVKVPTVPLACRIVESISEERFEAVRSSALIEHDDGAMIVLQFERGTIAYSPAAKAGVLLTLLGEPPVDEASYIR